MIQSNRRGPLFTDLYELTMAQAYFDQAMNAQATFSLFLRTQSHRNYFVAAGLASVLDELSHLGFTDTDIEYLKSIQLFNEAFLDYLRSFRFTGMVHAMPEGSIFFPQEPVLEVTAPLIEAQIIETMLINTLGMSCLTATKAARCISAAGDRNLIDFSLRRTQGADAGMAVARNAYIAGFGATSNVLAGKTYGIPVAGTMAHSFVQTFVSETDAFEAYARSFPDKSIFLIDTYDTLQGARHGIEVALKMEKKGTPLMGIRLDSGDMITLSKQVRILLNDAGLSHVKIVASSGLDEYKIAELITGGAQIDAFGVGTRMGVSADHPYVDMVYKLVRYNGRDVRKLSPGKSTLAGRKQVYRQYLSSGCLGRDVIGERDEAIDGIPMLKTVMAEGSTTTPPPALEDIRRRFKQDFKKLDHRYKKLDEAHAYPVGISSGLKSLQERIG
ncbi:MAG: nicotinate phosphoribosyltransferase [Desulfobacteraceae bacterium]|nr:nicotinate phosphoribosyltransferase [Desulfobacteraceae bacterium]